MIKKKLLGKTLLLLAIVQMATCQKPNFGAACRSDDDCDAPVLICAENKCRNKDLFPARTQDIIGTILIIVASAFGIMVGIGGGVVVGPIGYILMNMSFVETNALSNSIALVIAIAKLANSLTGRHPENQKKVLIDYDVIYILAPFILIGSLLSSLITVILPELLILINFVGLMIFSCWAGVQNYKVNKAKELKAAEQKKEKEAKEKELEKTTVKPISTPETPDIDDKNLNVDEIPIEFEEHEQPCDKMHLKQKDPSSKKTVGEETARPIKDQEVGKKEITPFNPPVVAPLHNVTDGTLEKIKKKVLTEEERNFSPKKLFQVGLLFLFVNVVTVLRSGSGKKSVVGIERCSAWFWVLISCYVVVCLGFSFFGYRKWKRMVARKAKAGLVCPTDLKWPEKGLGFAIAKAIIIEFLSSISGIGGTGITVFILGLKVNVKSAVATSLYLVFISRFIVTFLNYLIGTLRLDYFLLIGGITVVVCFFADRLNNHIQQKVNKASVLNLIFISMVLMAMLVYGIGGSIKLNTKVAAGSPIFKFSPFC